MGRLAMSQLFPAPADELFGLVTDLELLPSLLGGAVEVGLAEDQGSMLEKGREFRLELTRFGLTTSVWLLIEDLVPGDRLIYRQVEGGVFRSWHHTQLLSPLGRGKTLLTELVSFRLPLGILGAVVDDLIVRRDLERLFRRRHEGLVQVLAQRLLERRQRT